jgi:hypothetical protein
MPNLMSLPGSPSFLSNWPLFSTNTFWAKSSVAVHLFLMGPSPFPAPAANEKTVNAVMTRKAWGVNVLMGWQLGKRGLNDSGKYTLFSAQFYDKTDQSRL